VIASDALFLFTNLLSGVEIASGTYQESCPLGVLELSTFLKLTSI
jgi:hypothetical protein